MNTLAKVGNGLKIAGYVIVAVPLFLIGWGLGAARDAVSRLLWGPAGGP